MYATIKEPDIAVREQLQARRQQALAIAEERQHSAYTRCPELYALDSRMAQEAMEIAAVAMLPGGAEVIEEIKVRLMELQGQKTELLGSIGMTIDDLQPPYHCKKCSDTGYAAGIRCGCWNELYCIEAGKRLPAQANDGRCSFDSFRLDYYPEKDDKGEDTRRTMRRIAEICMEYAERVGSGAGNLLFIGKTGLGKTHLSLAIAARAVQRGMLVRYASAQSIIDCFERTRFNRNPASADWDFVNSVNGCNLLVIDDLGSEFVTSFSQSVLYNIINDRMMNGFETIISTNLDAARLTATYEQRISSRILCGYRALGFAGRDIRMLQRLEKQ